MLFTIVLLCKQDVGQVFKFLLCHQKSGISTLHTEEQSLTTHNTHTHIYMYTYKNKQTHTCIHIHIYIHIHTHNTHIHNTYIHTYIHIHIHTTHTQCTQTQTKKQTICSRRSDHRHWETSLNY